MRPGRSEYDGLDRTWLLLELELFPAAACACPKRTPRGARIARQSCVARLWLLTTSTTSIRFCIDTHAIVTPRGIVTSNSSTGR